MTHSQRKPRGRAEVVVYGRRAVSEALGSASVEPLAVRAAEGLPKDVRTRLRELCDSPAGGEGVEIEWTTGEAVRRWSHDGRNDQGVAARVRLKRVVSIDAFADSVRGAGGRSAVRVIGFDGVTNPQNIGMIVRCAAAFGFGAVLWPTRGTPWVEGLVVKASAGTVFGTTILPCETAGEGAGELAGHGFRIAGLDAGGEVALGSFEAAHRQVMLVGAENAGLSAEVLGLVDARVRIEMAGVVESLNVATAAGIVTYALRAES